MRNRPFLILSAIVVAAYSGSADAQSLPRTLSAAEIAVVCAPAFAVTQQPADALRIIGGQDSEVRLLFGPQDLVIVNGGTQAGVQIGQEYFVRRQFQFGRPPRSQPQTVRTAGWLRIVAVNDTTAIAQLDMACDGVRAGDYLEPFTVPVVPAAGATPVTFAALDFSSLGRVMFGDEERRIGGTGDFMLIEYGTVGVAPGTRVAVYRDLRRPGLPLTAVGEGLIVSVENGMPLMRITAARDAVLSGDYVVPYK